jgi:MFS transporter, UMF1 family
MIPDAPRSSLGQRLAWALYDFANSSFNTVIITAVYVIYFKNVVVGANEAGTADNLWGLVNSAGAAIVFVIAPVLGTIADIRGRKRQFLIFFTGLCVLATAGLYWAGPGDVVLAMALLITSIVGFEAAFVFYNSFLPNLVPPNAMGRLSGQAWALGYFGGLGCLLAVLPFASEHTTAVPLFVAGWFALFSLPALFLLEDSFSSRRPQTDGLIAEALGRLAETKRDISAHLPLVRLLTSYFFYNNGVATIIVFAVAFSAESLGFTIKENILLITVMNLVAAPAAFSFGRLADRIGAKITLVSCLLIWLVVVAGAELAAWPALFSPADAKMVFWGVSGLASLAIGATQATSRAYVGKLAPPDKTGEFFGFMAFAGKGSAVLGPLVFGLTSDLFNSQRAAVLSIGLFFAVGLVLLARVPSDAERIDH